MFDSFSPNRRKFLETSAALGAASLLSTNSAVAAQGQPAFEEAPNGVRPFRISVPQSELVELRRRIAAARWPTRELVADDTQGVQLETMRKLAQYWATDYDWRKGEAKLNALPQYTTKIDGLEIHFIHVRSKHQNALPIIITHGWPGSFIEQTKVIDPLTNPTAHGASASDAFHVVIPSIPGYGYSSEPRTLGWDPVRIARAWFVLMKRLEYNKFAAQGGDWGASITQLMALQSPADIVGIHTNMPGTVPADVLAAATSGGSAPAGLSPDELHAFEQLKDFYTKHLGYAIEMSNRPQTLYGLTDSPIALASWILDHDKDSYELIASVFDGQPAGLTRDDVLDNITMYWLTKTGISSARLYWENKLGFFDIKHVMGPVGVSAFPHEIYTAPRSWAEKAYPKLVYYKKHDVGGHFAAWEQPQLFSEDVRATFRSLRTSST